VLRWDVTVAEEEGYQATNYSIRSLTGEDPPIFLDTISGQVYKSGPPRSGVKVPLDGAFL
jgi:hypothetical protein